VNKLLQDGVQKCNRKFTEGSPQWRKCICYAGIKAYEAYIRELKSKIPLCKENKKCIQTLSINIQIANGHINKAKEELSELSHG